MRKKTQPDYSEETDDDVLNILGSRFSKLLMQDGHGIRHRLKRETGVEDNFASKRKPKRVRDRMH